METMKQYLYYILIGIISFLAIAFLPMIGSSQEIGWGLPQSSAAWAVWIISRVAASVLNVLIYHCFIRQANLNTKNDPNRLKAEKILNKLNKKKEKAPISPSKFFFNQYARKVPMIAASTMLSLLAIGPAILMFDWVIFIAYLVSVIISIIFGILEMKKVEEFYTEGLLQYAEWRTENEETMEQIHCTEQVDIQPVEGLENICNIHDSSCDSECGSLATVSISDNNRQ